MDNDLDSARPIGELLCSAIKRGLPWKLQSRRTESKSRIHLLLAEAALARPLQAQDEKVLAIDQQARLVIDTRDL
jgi:hypothetical protein